MAASTVVYVYTHTSAQCSPASVGLAQACPNHATRVTTLQLKQPICFHSVLTISLVVENI